MEPFHLTVSVTNVKRGFILVELKVLQCYLDLVPRPTKEEYTVLKESLILEGQKDPIVINSKGIILDGHTRYEILTDIGKKDNEIDVRIKDIEDADEEELYVMSSNSNRRQLNTFQKIEMYYKKYLEFKRQATDNHINSKHEKKYPIGGSSLRYAVFLGVGSRRCADGIKLLECADEPALNRLRSGVTTINQEYNRMLKFPKQINTKRSYKHIYPSVKKLIDFNDADDNQKLNIMIAKWRKWRDETGN